jgi:two-component system OmpR family response regulator
MRILVLEDDRELGKWITSGLRRAGHIVDWFQDGSQALTATTDQSYGVAVFDRMTPGLDGLSVLKAMRALNNSTPVLFLTALTDVEDRVEGLEAGGDDYLGKPFAFTELLARVNALERRNSSGAQDGSTTLKAKDLTLDLIKRHCVRQGQSIDLNTKEFQLLELFLRNPGRVLTKAMLLERVWDLRFDPTTSVVETHISRLRSKIDKPFEDKLISTVRGAGYELAED